MPSAALCLPFVLEASQQQRSPVWRSAGLSQDAALSESSLRSWVRSLSGTPKGDGEIYVFFSRPSGTLSHKKGKRKRQGSRAMAGIISPVFQRCDSRTPTLMSTEQQGAKTEQVKPRVERSSFHLPQSMLYVSLVLQGIYHWETVSLWNGRLPFHPFSTQLEFDLLPCGLKANGGFSGSPSPKFSQAPGPVVFRVAPGAEASFGLARGKQREVPQLGALSHQLFGLGGFGTLL